MIIHMCKKKEVYTFDPYTSRVEQKGIGDSTTR